MPTVAMFVWQDPFPHFGVKEKQRGVNKTPSLQEPFAKQGPLARASLSSVLCHRE